MTHLTKNVFDVSYAKETKVEIGTSKLGAIVTNIWNYRNSCGNRDCDAGWESFEMLAGNMFTYFYEWIY